MIKNRGWPSRLATLLVCLLVSSTVRAQLFDLNASSSTTNVTAGGSSLIGLVDHLTNTTNQFAPLSNQSFIANLTYAGIPRAITFEQSFDTSGNRLVSVQVPSVGLNKTFSSANGSLSTQVKNYLQHDGLADLTAFQAYVARSSPAGVVDGNPMAATALLQDAGFQQFGLHADPFDISGQRFNSAGGHMVTRVWADGGVQDDGGVSGDYVNLTIATELYFNDFIGLSFTTPLRYETLKSADIFMGGELIGLPLQILPAKGGPFSWQLTPGVHAGAVGSQDLVSGGLLYGGQITSSLSYNTRGFTFTLADQAGYYHGADVDIAGYHFNTPLNQWLFKNGLQVSKSFGNFFIDASGSWTDFSRDAFVKGYLTPELGIGVKFGPGCGVRLGYNGNFGNNYNSNGGNLMLYFAQ
jgi:hypothetical protein